MSINELYQYQKEIVINATEEEIQQVLAESRTGTQKDKVALLWSLFSEIDYEKGFKKIYDKIKVDGYICEFDIRTIIQGNYEEHPSKRIIEIQGWGRYDIQKYYDEIEERIRIMRHAIRMAIPKKLQGELEDEEYDQE